jgi:hypothetical protein
MDFNRIGEGRQIIIDNSSLIASIANSNADSVVAVTQITTSSGISTNVTNNTIDSTGDIFLYANINQLLNVNAGSPAQNQVLTYSGTSWMAKAFDGTSIASFSALEETPSSMTSQGDKYVKVNSAGTCLEYVTLDAVQSIYGGEGIAHYSVQGDRKQKIVFDSSSFDTTTTSAIDHKVLVRRGDGQNKLIRFDDINMSNLDNSGSCFITVNDLTAGYGISLSVASGDVTFSFLDTVVPANNFNTGGICGILPITYGGTSASSITGAQISLELQPNVHILARSGPSFRGLMHGVNINLMPDTFNLALTYSGQGYDPNDPTLTLRNPADTTNDTFTLSVGFFNSGNSVGQIPSVLIGQMSNYHTDGVCIYNLYSPLAGGTSAQVTVTPEIQYLTFGPQTDTSIGLSSAIGFRNYYGDIQFRASRTTAGASSWRSIFPLNMYELDDVRTGAFTTNDMLIYTGTCFQPYNMKGHATLTGAAVLSLNIPDDYIGADKLHANGQTITNAEIGYLSGLDSNVQAQIDTKIGLSNGVLAADGDLIYFDGAGTCWRPLRAPASGTSMIIFNNTNGKPEYEFPGNIFGACGSSPSLTQFRFGYFEPEKPGYRITFKSILDEVVQLKQGDAAGASTALRVDGNSNMLVSYTNLNPGTSIATTDLISYQGSSDDYLSYITKENWAKTLSGEGLSAAAGNIRFNYDGVSLPYFRFKAYTVANAPTAVGVSGKMIYVENGDAGAACMAVSYDDNWKRISFGANISAS